jgi:hypothetical protein
MAEKWMVKEESGGENMPLYYAVYDETGHLVSMHYAREDAKLMAVSRLMLKALTRLLEIIERDDNVTHNIEYADLTILDQVRAAIAAAKGK